MREDGKDFMREEMWVREVLDEAAGVRRSVDVRTRMRYRPVEGKSNFQCQHQYIYQKNKTRKLTQTYHPANPSYIHQHVS